MKSFKTLALLLVLTAGTAGLAACENTWRGAGADLEEAGEEMQNDYDGNNY